MLQLAKADQVHFMLPTFCPTGYTWTVTMVCLRTSGEARDNGVKIAVCSTSNERAVATIVRRLLGADVAAVMRVFAGVRAGQGQGREQDCCRGCDWNDGEVAAASSPGVCAAVPSSAGEAKCCR